MTVLHQVSNTCRESVYHGKSLFIAIASVIWLGGCATTGGSHLAQLETPVKVLIVESPLSIDPGRLQKVLATDSKTELSLPEKPLEYGIAHAQDYALSAMQSALARQPGLIVVPMPAEGKPFIDSVRDSDLKAGLTQDAADHIQSITGADALLRFTITDYGLTPTAWRKGYITFEVTTTLGLAAIIAYSGSTVARAAAGAYLVQEAVEETAEAYAGFWALDVVCRPVRIEAELIKLHPLTTAWKYHDTGLSDVRLSRLTSVVTPEERVGQLDQATDYAITDIVAVLSNVLRNSKPQRLYKP